MTTLEKAKIIVSGIIGILCVIAIIGIIYVWGFVL